MNFLLLLMLQYRERKQETICFLSCCTCRIHKMGTNTNIVVVWQQCCVSELARWFVPILLQLHCGQTNETLWNMIAWHFTVNYLF